MCVWFIYFIIQNELGYYFQGKKFPVCQVKKLFENARILGFQKWVLIKSITYCFKTFVLNSMIKA